MLNRGTEPSLSSTEDSSEEETEEETVISEQKESFPNEKEQLSQLELSSNKTEERRSESGLYKVSYNKYYSKIFYLRIPSSSKNIVCTQINTLIPVPYTRTTQRINQYFS